MTYNLSSIMKSANSYAKEIGKSAALKRAWAEAKIDSIENKQFMLSMKDRWNNEDYETNNSWNNEIAKLRARITEVAEEITISEKRKAAAERMNAKIVADWEERQEREMISFDAFLDRFSFVRRTA